MALFECGIGDENSDGPLITEEERKSLLETESLMARLHSDRAAVGLGSGAVAKELKRQRDVLHQKTMAGEDVTGLGIDSADHVRENVLIRGESLRLRLCQIYKEQAEPILKTVLQRFSDRLENLLRSKEENDRETAALLNMPYVPGVESRACAAVYVAVNTGRLVSGERYELPSRVLSGLLDLNVEGGGAQ